MRRVVVTGLGMVTPLACGVDATWQRILESKSGARRIETFDVSDLACKIACQVPRGDGSDGSFNPGPVDGAEGAAQGRRLHHLCDERGDAGAGGCRLEADKP